MMLHADVNSTTKPGYYASSKKPRLLKSYYENSKLAKITNLLQQSKQDTKELDSTSDS